MVTTTKFCSVSDVNAYLNNEVGYEQDNALIERQIEQATALIREYTRRDWERGTYVDYFDTATIDRAIAMGRTHVSFYLRERPLVIDEGVYPSVQFNTSGRWDNALPLNPSAFNVNVRLGSIVMYPSVMRYYGQSIRVSYMAGYPIDGEDSSLCLVASNLKSACAQQAAFAVRRTINETSGSRSSGNKLINREYAMTQSGLVAEAHALVRSSARILVGGDA